MSSPLANEKCEACEGGVPPLTAAEAQTHLAELKDHWSVADDGKSISAQFSFRNYYQTTAFVNAVAWIAHREVHHPDISFGWNSCTVLYQTHAVDGLTRNDFICAAKIDALLD